MLGLGFTETIVLAGIILVVMGPEKFPDVAKVIMRTVREFRGYWDDAQREITKEINPLKKELNTLSRYKPEEFVDHFTGTKSEKTPEELDPDLADSDSELAEPGASGYGVKVPESSIPEKADPLDTAETDSVDEAYKPRPYNPGGLAATDEVPAAEADASEAPPQDSTPGPVADAEEHDEFDDLSPPPRLEG